MKMPRMNEVALLEGSIVRQSPVGSLSKGSSFVKGDTEGIFEIFNQP